MSRYQATLRSRSLTVSDTPNERRRSDSGCRRWGCRARVFRGAARRVVFFLVAMETNPPRGVGNKRSARSAAPPDYAPPLTETQSCLRVARRLFGKASSRTAGAASRLAAGPSAGPTPSPPASRAPRARTPRSSLPLRTPRASAWRCRRAWRSSASRRAASRRRPLAPSTSWTARQKSPRWSSPSGAGYPGSTRRRSRRPPKRRSAAAPCRRRSPASPRSPWTRSWSELDGLPAALSRRLALRGDHERSAAPPGAPPGRDGERLHARPPAAASRVHGAPALSLGGAPAGGGAEAAEPRREVGAGGATAVTPRVRDVVGLVIAVAIAAGCVRLGVWQLDRLQQRRARNAEVRAAGERPAVEARARLPADSAASRRVHAAGRYDYAHQRLWRARSYEGVPGVALVTPLRLADGSAGVVDRGWAPSPDAAHVDEQAYREPDTADVLGLGFRAPRGRGDVNPARLQGSLPDPLLPFILEQGPPAPGVSRPLPPGLIRWPPPPLDDGPHLSYAIQWFCFAVIILVGSVVLLGKSRGTGREATNSGSI